jgi:hypothetical protein
MGLIHTHEGERTRSSIRETAKQFFDACETGYGWEVCKQYCHPQATFTAQADALAGVDNLEAHAEWMKELFTPLPDSRYEARSFALDEGQHTSACEKMHSPLSTERSCQADFPRISHLQTKPSSGSTTSPTHSNPHFVSTCVEALFPGRVWARTN